MGNIGIVENIPNNPISGASNHLVYFGEIADGQNHWN
jgi:hypothetical protein